MVQRSVRKIHSASRKGGRRKRTVELDRVSGSKSIRIGLADSLGVDERDEKGKGTRRVVEDRGYSLELATHRNTITS